MTYGRHVVCCLAVVLLAGCDGDDGGSGPPSTTLQGATACERFASLAQAKGCATPASCTLPSACETQAIAWIDCAASDLTQCLCESDGDLNCEGSYKANEGPARCVAEMQAFDACETANASP